MGYVNGAQGTYATDNPNWVESAIDGVADWIGGLFGQADERNRRRFAQNEEAFRRAAAGGEWDREFLKHRTGNYGTVRIPIQLPYAVSPSNGRPETPGDIGAWATGPAQRHAAALFDKLDQWGGPPGSVPEVDPQIVAELYDLARTDGPDIAREALAVLAARLYGNLPDEYRQAVERGIRDHYAGDPRVQAGGLGVLAALGIGFALLRRKR